MTNKTLHASCLCRAVRWEIDEPVADEGDDPLGVLRMCHCHCSRCRKAHGAPFATFMAVAEAQFRHTHGTEAIAHSPAGPGSPRSFCRHCGSIVPDGRAWNGFVGTPVGPIDEAPSVRPRAHVFTSSKAPWVEIADGLPQFEAYPDGMAMTPLPTRAPLDPPGEGARGSCLCGGVTFVVTKPAIRCRSCHCSRCRKALSGAYGSYLVVALDGVRFTRGEELVERYKVPEAQYFASSFCSACGSKVARRDEARNITLVPMGVLDDDPGVRPSSHIFVGSKADWYVITDSAPQYDELPPT